MLSREVAKTVECYHSRDHHIQEGVRSRGSCAKGQCMVLRNFKCSTRRFRLVRKKVAGKILEAGQSRLERVCG